MTFGFPCPLKQLFDELLRDVQRNEFEDDICLVRMEIQRTGQTGYRVMERGKALLSATNGLRPSLPEVRP